MKTEANKALCFLKNLKGNTAKPQVWPCHCSGGSLQWLPLVQKVLSAVWMTLQPATPASWLTVEKNWLVIQEVLLPEAPPQDLPSLNMCTYHLSDLQQTLLANAPSFFFLVLMYHCQQDVSVLHPLLCTSIDSLLKDISLFWNHRKKIEKS